VLFWLQAWPFSRAIAQSGSQQEPSFKPRQHSPSYSPPETSKSRSNKVPGVDFGRPVSSVLQFDEEVSEIIKIVCSRTKAAEEIIQVTERLSDTWDQFLPQQIRFWKKQKSKDRRKLRPEHERFLDTSRFDDMPAKFNPSNSNHGQDKNKYYCSKCDVETSTLSLMQAHKEGAKHKRMCAQVQHFRCDLCLIQVPCRDTLDNHMRGKDHIKRAMQLEEERQKKGEVVAGEGRGGYRVGPSEMAKLAQTEKEEMESLRKTVRTLQAIVKEQNQKLAKFKAGVA